MPTISATTELVPLSRSLPAQQVRFALHFLAQSGFALEDLLRGTGIDLADIDKADFVFRERALWPLCTNLAARFGEGWYLQLPMLWGPELQSEVGLVVRYAPNYGEAIATTVEMVGVRWPIVTVRQRAVNGSQLIEIERTDALPAEHWIMVQVFAAMNFQSSSATFLGDDVARLHYRFDAPAPPYHAAVTALLKGEIVWNAQGATVEVPDSLCARVSPLANHNSYVTLLESLHRAQQRVEREDSVSGRVQAFLERITVGQKRADSVAAALGMARRTLERKLADEGTAFGTLADAALKYRLERLLSDGLRAPDALAEVLGYHDGSSLKRACLRWYGMSLSALRQKVAS